MKLSFAVITACVAAAMYGGKSTAAEVGSNTYNEGTAADQKAVVGDGNLFTQPVAPLTSITGNVVIGADNTIRAADSIVIGSQNDLTTSGNIIIGDRSFVGGVPAVTSAVVVGSDSQSQLQGVSIGNSSESRDYGTAVGADSTAGSRAVALGYQSNAIWDDSIAIGNGSEAVGPGAIAIGAGASSLSGAIAIGAGSTATEANTVAFSDGVTLRRLTGIADAINGSDAVSLSQMDAITSAMSTDIADLTSRIVVLEGSPAAPGVTAGDLRDAELRAELNDMSTLADAQSYAAAGDARTLSTAEARAGVMDARTLSLAQTYADIGDARTLEQANTYARGLVDDLEDDLSGGIAAVAAMPAAPALAAGQKAVAMGMAYYNGAPGLGVTAGWSPRDGITVSASLGGAQGGEPVIKAATSVIW